MGGTDHWNVDMRDCINIVTSYHKLSLDQFGAFSGWFMGRKTSTLTKLYDMNINLIDPEDNVNLGLVNRYKINLRQLKGSLHLILKDYVSRTSCNYFYPKKKHFIYTDERSGQHITFVLTLFMMALQVINPQLVIDHQAKERKMEDMTIELCNNNVRTYLMNMQ